VCVCVFMCWIAKYLCWSSVGEAFSLTYLLLLISAARSERERERKKERLFGTHHGDRDGAAGAVGVVVGGHQVAHVEGRLGHRVHFACEANKTRDRLVSAKFTRYAHATHRRRGCAHCSSPPHCCSWGKNCFGSSPAKSQNAQHVSHVH
jgi:hypothetical protein